MSTSQPLSDTITDQSGKRRARLRDQKPTRHAAKKDMRPRIDIPVRDPAPEDEACQTLFRRGRHLARQDQWEQLCTEIRDADLARQMTPGRSSSALWLARGARADVVKAACRAIDKGDPRTAHAALTTLEFNLDDAPHCPSLGLVIALAHVDLASAWLGNALLRALPQSRQEAWHHHMQSAAAMLDRYDPIELDSAMWAYARCAVLAADPHAIQRVADDYEDLVDLDPRSPAHLVAMGRDLLPTRFGSYEVLEVQARRTLARTTDVWGTGAYSWIFIGALEHDPGAFLRLDAELFCEGLHDILEFAPGQHSANRLAAFCGLTISGQNVSGSARARLASCFNWIVEDHLRELHPLVWANAAASPNGHTVSEDPDLVRRGMARALSTLAERYADRITNGNRLVFSPSGLTFPRAT